jgi:hypothetical protein
MTERKKHIKLFEEYESQDIQNYMFFSNLESIKRMCDSLLSRDPQRVDQILNAGGHDWASDHVAAAKVNLEQVENFFTGEFEDSAVAESKEFKSPDGVIYYVEQDGPRRFVVLSKVKGFPATEAWDDWFANRESAEEVAQQLAANEL